MRVKLSNYVKAGVMALLGFFSLALITYFFFKKIKTPIKIGILHSLTGSQAFSEKPMVDAELMAIAELNSSIGLLNHEVVGIVADGKSDEKVFAQEAERLIKEEKVSAIIGCWTSASRKAVKAVVEKYNNLLIYPVSYEGLEDSPQYILCRGQPESANSAERGLELLQFG